MIEAPRKQFYIMQKVKINPENDDDCGDCVKVRGTFRTGNDEEFTV